jgi:hypothetical protein
MGAVVPVAVLAVVLVSALVAVAPAGHARQ